MRRLMDDYNMLHCRKLGWSRLALSGTMITLNLHVRVAFTMIFRFIVFLHHTFAHLRVRNHCDGLANVYYSTLAEL